MTQGGGGTLVFVPKAYTVAEAGGTVTLREPRKIDKSDVASSETEPDTAVATPKPRVKKTKSRNKKSE